MSFYKLSSDTLVSAISVLAKKISTKNHSDITLFLTDFKLRQLDINPLRAAGKKSQQCGTSLSHRGREKLTEKHQLISEGKSREPQIISSHTAPQKIAKEISFHMTTNDMMVAEQV